MQRRSFLTVATMSLLASNRAALWALPSAASKNILDFGAKPDGVTINTTALQEAIDALAGAGGGTVYVPAGTFLTGGVELRSGIHLYLAKGAVLLGSTAIADFAYHPGPPVRGDSNGHHLVFANNCDDVSISGPGCIDGQGQAYEQRKDASKVLPPAEAWRDVSSQRFVPINNNLRPSPLIEFAQCRNVHVSEVTLKNSPGWMLRTIATDGVVIDGITVRNPPTAVNGDGMDITSSQNVIVSNCDVAAGDDGICLKSENPYGLLVPTRNVVVKNCKVTTPCNGLKIGTASKGAFEHIQFSNCLVYADVASPLNTRPISGISIEVVDGGSLDGVIMSGIRMQNVRTPIFIRLGQRQKADNTFLRNVVIQDVEATGAIIASSITGVPGLRPSDITISCCRVHTVEQGTTDWATRTIPEVANGYPEAWMMGRLPAYGFFVRHADRVHLQDITYVSDKGDGRPAVVCVDAQNVLLKALRCTAPAGGAAVINLNSVQGVTIANMQPPPGAHAVVQISGADSSNISFAGDGFSPDSNTVVFADGATKAALATGL